MTSFTRKKTLVISLITLGIAAFLASLLLFEYWVGHSPATPRPATGEIYALNQHGYYFYVTRTQKMLHQGLLYAFGIFFFSGAILDMRWKTVRNLIDDAPKKFY